MSWPWPVGPPPRPAAPSAAIGVGIAVVGYFVLLGWHEQQEYVEWKAWTYAIVLGLVAIWAGSRGQKIGFVTSMAVTIAVTGLWSADASTEGPTDDMWLVGAELVLLALGGASFILVLISDYARECMVRRRFRRWLEDQEQDRLRRS